MRLICGQDDDVGVSTTEVRAVSVVVDVAYLSDIKRILSERLTDGVR